MDQSSQKLKISANHLGDFDCLYETYTQNPNQNKATIMPQVPNSTR